MISENHLSIVSISSAASSRGKHNEIAIIASTNNPIAPDAATETWNLSAERVSAITNTRCTEARIHAMGEFCYVCRTILMPWIDKLPRAIDDNGQTISRASSKSILGHVNLSDDEAIAVVALVAIFDVANQRYDQVDGLVQIMEKFPRAVAAGYRVADIYRYIFRISTPSHDIPAIADIIQTALDDPHQSPEEYMKGVEFELSLEAPLRPLYGATPYFGKIAAKPSPARVPTPDDLRPDVQGNNTHKPPRGGPWEFVPGTNLEKAVLGRPEPNKCFLTRQSKEDPSIKDVRQFPSWATIDWNDPADIAAFNKWLEQNKGRVEGRIGKYSAPWTQAEKDVLKSIVEASINDGKTQRTMDWDAIAQTLVNHFKDITQHEGEPLAQSTKLNPNNTIDRPRLKYPKKLKSDRVGGIMRPGNMVKIQAMRYGDIALLLRLTSKYKPRGIRADGDNISDTADESDDFEEDTQSDNGGNNGHFGPKLATGSKRRRQEEEEDNGSLKRRKTLLPPNSAEDFAKQVSTIPKSVREKMKKSNSLSDPPSEDFSPYQ